MVARVRRFEVGIREREWLRRFAIGVANDLKKQPLEAFRSQRRIAVPRAPYTDGWYADVGTVDVPGVDSVSVFLDRITGGNEPRIWAGVFVRGELRFASIVKHLRRHLATVAFFPASAFTVADTTGQVLFKSPLPRAKFGIPVAEGFEKELKDVGVYWPNRVDWRRAPSRDIIGNTVAFLSEVIGALETHSMASTTKPFYNKSTTVTTRVIARSNTQAKAALRRDEWTCRICKDKPERRYGIDGRRCLEAHHVEALHARIGRRTTRVQDLVTVCANCHRVLAVLPPNKRGYVALRSRFRHRPE